MAVPHTFGDVSPEDEEGLESEEAMGIGSLTGTPDGADQISFQDLLKLTPEAQTAGWEDNIPDRKLPVVFGHPNSSMRESCGLMMLAIGYDNSGPWRPGLPGLNLPFVGAIKPITYTYRPYFLPTKHNRRVEVQMSLDSASHRVVNIWYGVTIQMSFEGTLVKFAMAELLKVLTTGIVLLSTATTIVVSLAIYVLKDREKYLLQIYQVTEIMKDYKKLDKTKEPVTSFTGDLLKSARGSSADGELTNREITDILVDYEIRLNRVDGRDPKLAFPQTSDIPQDEQVATMRNNLVAQRSKWFHERIGVRDLHRDRSDVEASEGQHAEPSQMPGYKRVATGAF